MELARDDGAPGRARTAIRRWSRDILLEPLRRDALELLVSEAVTNSVRHAISAGETPINLVACFAGNEILVTVTDSGLGPLPRMRTPSSDLGGYGLHILDSESRRWGVERTGRTSVWFAV